MRNSSKSKFFQIMDQQRWNSNISQSHQFDQAQRQEAIEQIQVMTNPTSLFGTPFKQEAIIVKNKRLYSSQTSRTARTKLGSLNKDLQMLSTGESTRINTLGQLENVNSRDFDSIKCDVSSSLQVLNNKCLNQDIKKSNTEGKSQNFYQKQQMLYGVNTLESTRKSLKERAMIEFQKLELQKNAEQVMKKKKRNFIFRESQS
ncbi:UNKNOWN [Stylonychia lemnae]|uniref:Uncharacterized protein n=1 Tax=Stylonychia lemnae TaxID=5949 RepID=A0A078AV22_STYLE|nr:UNKNOWN [Stylonychia lemnae]|eukprot:CDW85851.1 UNKNOWN [Stylonychia lemnae]